MKNRMNWLSRCYWLFWLLPIILLPFPWVKAVVDEVEVLQPIDGTGFLVAKNFSTSALMYVIFTLGMLLAEFSRKSLNIKIVILVIQTFTLAVFSTLPRIILGPTGLTKTGFQNLDFYTSAYLLAVRPAYTISLVSLLLAVLSYYYFQIYRAPKN